MKITIKDTNPKREFSHDTVTIESQYDESNIDDIIDMFARALIARGFSVDLVKERLEVEL